MKIFKQLNKKGYKHYYEGTVEELDSMDKDNQHLHSEIMQVIIWLYEKHGFWISSIPSIQGEGFDCNYYVGKDKFGINKHPSFVIDSPIEAYKAAIEHCLTKLI